MKKRFYLIAAISFFAATLLCAQSSTGAVHSSVSIEDVIRKFDTAVLNASIPKAEVAIGFISYANTETSGTVVPWIQVEIKKAAAKMRRISIVQSKNLHQQEQKGIATHGASFDKAKNKASSAKYIITGRYYENKDSVELTLELMSTDGKLPASNTAVIPLTELENRNLTLYPENKAQAETISKDFEKAEEELQTEHSSQEKTQAGEPNGTIQITAVMLDAEDNLVDILYPGDTVKFKVSVNEPAYIAILGIDANGHQYRLPVKNNFLWAESPRIFPDTDMEYQVVEGVFGAEYIFIYAASNEQSLPKLEYEGQYTQNNLAAASRGIKAVKKAEKSAKTKIGVYKIIYTVLEK